MERLKAFWNWWDANKDVLGSMGDWAAAIATFVAVIVSVRTAQKANRIAEEANKKMEELADTRLRINVTYYQSKNETVIRIANITDRSITIEEGSLCAKKFVDIPRGFMWLWKLITLEPNQSKVIRLSSSDIREAFEWVFSERPDWRKHRHFTVQITLEDSTGKEHEGAMFWYNEPLTENEPSTEEKQD